MLLGFVLAILIGNAAARLAGGLARGLALTAAAVLGTLAEIAGLDGLDLDHDDCLHSIDFTGWIISCFFGKVNKFI